MNIYNPIDGELYTRPITLLPCKCFIMTKLGEPVPGDVATIRKAVEYQLKQKRIEAIDANERVTGRDFLLKIWEIMAAVPLGIGIITETTAAETINNIFYEMGAMQALGKETLIVKSAKARIPSDFVRTEHVVYDVVRKPAFYSQMKKYFNTYYETAEHYLTVAKELEVNPTASIDYYIRSYLIKPDDWILRKFVTMREVAQLNKSDEDRLEKFLKQFDDF